jgi:hypothetical protein
MPTENPMPPELERKLYYEGIHLFNDLEYFEAHEAWEEAWRAACGRKFSFYQGMIQCAVALEHYRRSNPAGVMSLYTTYRPKFRGLPPVFMGLEVAPFLEQMRQSLALVVDAAVTPQKGQIQLDVAHVPKITLLYDPFETGEAQSYDRLEGT